MEERPQLSTPASISGARRRWHFATASLDERSLELTVNGVDTELERKPLEVLMYLLQHAGEVCTKDELLAGVWPGRVLSETVLTKCIGRLRDALGDADQQIIKTAYGFGYRLIAPVKVETVAAPVTPHFDFRPGDHPPGRPLWSLIERLGVGGHGEAWRGRHDKTYEQRVFKFALDEASLGALKREITLFRVINDTAGPSARVVRLLDWNLEQSPYFIEAEYITGGSLVDWVNARGGIAALPLGERLEIVARLADALAAVHSVGVLHKDLKPSNILIRLFAGPSFDVLLADFGSGAMLDAAHLERLGITKLGFTKTLSTVGGTSGTPIYLAPEIVAGQPFTVKADIYALGVILYQFAVGDFTRFLSPGWERDIEDELLRADIALLAEGNPAIRMADANEIARRLRTLPERHEELRLEREAHARAERASRLLEQARARRVGIRVAFAALLIGLVTSTALFLRAREANLRSEEAASRSHAVTEFLSKDVFAPVSSGSEPVKDLRVTELLTRTGNQIDTRFARQPEVASELHYIVARSLNQFAETGLAVSHFNRALTQGRKLQGEGSVAALRSAAELVNLDYALGHLPNTIGSYEATLVAGRATLDPHDKSLLTLQMRLALGRYLLGDWQQAAIQLQAVIPLLRASDASDAALIGRAHLYMGQTLVALARPVEARTHLHAAIESLSRALSEQHSEVAEARDALGRALTLGGQYAEAQRQLDQAEALALRWEPHNTTWRLVRPRVYKALLSIERDEPERARPVLQQIVDFQDAHTGEHPDLDHTGTVRQALAETYLRVGQSDAAVAILQTAVRVSERADGVGHPTTRSIRLSLGEALLATGVTPESRQIVAAIVADDLDKLPREHPFVAQLQRVGGLFALEEGDRAGARQLLGKALATHEAFYGAKHWRTQRVRRELLRAAN